MSRIRYTPLALGLMAGSLGAAQAAATPCVGVGFDHPFPGATGVLTRYADVPSPRFPGLWQEGRIRGYPYFIYANGEASLQDAMTDPTWSVFVLCDLENSTCTETTEGTPPQDALQIANLMGQCFVAPETVKAPPPAAPKPDPVAPPTDGWALAPPPEPPLVAEPPVLAEPPVETEPPVGAPPLVVAEPPIVAEPPLVAEPPVIAEVVPETPPAPPCGLAAVPEGEPGITVQLLLIEAGADPGPIDGLPGRKTRTALVQVLGEEAQGLEIEAAVTALDAFLCKPSE